MSKESIPPGAATAAPATTGTDPAADPPTATGSRTIRWRGHLPALDGVRGLAIALVVFCHAFLGIHGTHFVDSVLIETALAGWTGVDLFFVLSGFLITGILLDSREGGHYFRNFYIRRTLRIFPLYYGLLAVAFLVLPLLSSVQEAEWYADISPHRWWFWTYTSNVLTATHGWSATPIFGGFWSLAVEEQFYLLWPLVVLWCPPARLRRLCLWVMAGAVIFRLAIRWRMAPELAAYTLMPARADALAAGAWIAASLRAGTDPADLHRWARLLLPASGLVALVIFAWERSFSEVSFIVQTVGYSCLALGFGAILCLCLDAPERETMLGRVFRVRALGTLGKYSYAMYCFNPLVWMGLRRLGFTPGTLPEIGGSNFPRTAVFGAILLGISLLLAKLSWHLYEVHFLKLKDRWAPVNRGHTSHPVTDVQPPIGGVVATPQGTLPVGR